MNKLHSYTSFSYYAYPCVKDKAFRFRVGGFLPVECTGWIFRGLKKKYRVIGSFHEGFCHPRTRYMVDELLVAYLEGNYLLYKLLMDLFRGLIEAIPLASLSIKGREDLYCLARETAETHEVVFAELLALVRENILQTAEENGVSSEEVGSLAELLNPFLVSLFISGLRAPSSKKYYKKRPSLKDVIRIAYKIGCRHGYSFREKWTLVSSLLKCVGDCYIDVNSLGGSVSHQLLERFSAPISIIDYLYFVLRGQNQSEIPKIIQTILLRYPLPLVVGVTSKIIKNMGKLSVTGVLQEPLSRQWIWERLFDFLTTSISDEKRDDGLSFAACIFGILTERANFYPLYLLKYILDNENVDVCISHLFRSVYEVSRFFIVDPVTLIVEPFYKPFLEYTPLLPINIELETSPTEDPFRECRYQLSIHANKYIERNRLDWNFSTYLGMVAIDLFVEAVSKYAMAYRRFKEGELNKDSYFFIPFTNAVKLMDIIKNRGNNELDTLAPVYQYALDVLNTFDRNMVREILMNALPSFLAGCEAVDAVERDAKESLEELYNESEKFNPKLVLDELFNIC